MAPQCFEFPCITQTHFSADGILQSSYYYVSEGTPELFAFLHKDKKLTLLDFFTSLKS